MFNRIRLGQKFLYARRVSWRDVSCAVCSLWLILGAGILISCSTIERTVVAPPDVPGAMFVGNQVCYDCHTNYVRAFPSSPHARIHIEGITVGGTTPGGTSYTSPHSPASSEFESGTQATNSSHDEESGTRGTRPSNIVGCESCHGPGSKHVAAGGGRGQFIVNPGRDPAACFNCHLSQHAEFNLPQHHPVLEGKMNCVQCHDPHGLDIMKPAVGLAMARVNEQCATCHREQARRVVFEHEALREGCTTCHTPHGSVNEKLLVQPDPNLCLRCHAQAVGPGIGRGKLIIGKVDHSTLVTRGTCWTSTCHTAVHGSNVDPTLRY